MSNFLFVFQLIKYWLSPVTHEEVIIATPRDRTFLRVQKERVIYRIDFFFPL